MENVLAIGDNENDISMLQAAGISAAMENAEDDVKQAAKFVAGHNEEDGRLISWRNGCCKIKQRTKNGRAG